MGSRKPDRERQKWIKLCQFADRVQICGVNGAVKVLDVPPFIYSGRTYVPLRFVSEALGKEVRWDDQNRVVYIETGVESYTTTLAVSTGTATVNVVKVSLNDPTIKLEIVNAQDQIGVLEPFESMVERKNPLAAINGTFFQVADTSLPMEPAANLVINGRIEHLGTPENMPAHLLSLRTIRWILQT